MKIWTIGETDRVDVVSRRDADVSFDVEWFDEAGAPVAIAAVTVAEVTGRDGAVLLDLMPHAVVRLAPNAHVIAVNVDQATADLVPRGTDHGWRLVARSTLGEDRTLCWGMWRALR